MWPRLARPSAFANLWPNTTHIGAGIELIPVTSRAPIPRGIELSLVLDWSMYRNKIGVQRTLVQGVTFQGGERDKTVSRNVITVSGTLGF